MSSHQYDSDSREPSPVDKAGGLAFLTALIASFIVVTPGLLRAIFRAWARQWLHRDQTGERQ